MVSPAESVGDGSPAQDRTFAAETKGERLDLRGLRCPLPVLKAAKRLAAMAPGTKVAILADDPLARIDLPLFCHEENQRLVETRAEPDGATLFLVERGSAAPRLGRD